MELIQLGEKTHLLTCCIINKVTQFKFNIIDRWKFNKYIKNNIELKDIYLNETCYILGNGPSLKNVDLSLLKDKHVFTVNKSINTELFDEVNPEFHCVIDRFILDDVKESIIEKLNNSNCNTKFLVHRTGINTMGVDKNLYYIYNRHFPTKSNIRIDLTNNATTFYNVLPFTVLCAIYMGFKRIVLLGNDFSFFTARRDQHYYDIENNTDRKESLYQDLSGCSIVLLQYKVLRKYCEKNNIELVNATEGSLLDEIRQVKLEDYV